MGCQLAARFLISNFIILQEDSGRLRVWISLRGALQDDFLWSVRWRRASDPLSHWRAVQ